jgi:chlorite dismutase
MDKKGSKDQPVFGGTAGPGAIHGRSAPKGEGLGVKRQFVNFAFYKADAAWHRLSDSEREVGRKEFAEVVERWANEILIVPYSLVGLRADVDFMLWRIDYQLENFQSMTTELMKTGLGKYLSQPYSYLSMTKRSIYVDKHVHEEQEGSRLYIVPGESKYLFIYPFLKTREWFLLPPERRQEIMREHIEVGHKFPSIKLNTTYSFGLDDQEWVVAFESDQPEDFLDLVMALRETESSRYTLRDTPIFTCICRPLHEVLETIG